jgi:hypothetical protein
MIEMRRAQLSFGDGLIAGEVSDLREDWMRHADQVLADEEIVAAVYEALAKRHPRSRGRGRLGTPVARRLTDGSLDVMKTENVNISTVITNQGDIKFHEYHVGCNVINSAGTTITAYGPDTARGRGAGWRDDQNRAGRRAGWRVSATGHPGADYRRRAGDGPVLAQRY